MLLKSLALLAPVVAASSLASTALAQDVSAGALAGVASVISPEAKGALTAAVPLTDADREAMIKRRDASGFSLGRMPAASSSGSVSSKMRPFDSAIVMRFTIVGALPEENDSTGKPELKDTKNGRGGHAWQCGDYAPLTSDFGIQAAWERSPRDKLGSSYLARARARHVGNR